MSDLSSHPMDPKVMRNEWRKDTASVCIDCGKEVYKEPKGSHRWGCPNCGFATFNPSRHFKDAHTPASCAA